MSSILFPRKKLPAIGFVAPNILNNASFETGWDGMHSGGFTAPVGVTRVNTKATPYGSWTAYRNLPVTSPPGSGIGAEFDCAFYDNVWGFIPDRRADRVWTRFYIYLSNPIGSTGILKLNLLFGPSYGTQFSGFYFANGSLAMWASPEAWAGPGTHGQLTSLATIADGAWHCLEMDCWRNGDPTGYPSYAFYLDGAPFTAFTNGPPVAPASWIGGRYNLGVRTSSDKIGVSRWLGTLNQSPANDTAADVWLDRIALSTVGRIGP